MQKGVEIIGKALRLEATGEIIQGEIKDFICDSERNRIVGFWVQQRNESREVGVLPLSEVRGTECAALTISSKEVIVPASDIPAIKTVIEKSKDLRGNQLMTRDGRDLGQVLDLYFDLKTGLVEGYEVCGGIFADPTTGRTFVPATPLVERGAHIAIVSPETAVMMQEKASQRTRKAPINPLSTAAQKAFVVGKVAREEVCTPNGVQLVTSGQLITSAHAAVAQNRGVLKQLYCAAGGNRSHPSQEAKSLACFSRPVISRAQGWRAHETVRAQDGTIIAALGQIVTERVIERAITHHQEKALLDAVGLSADESMEIVCVEIAPSLRVNSEGTKRGSNSMWETFQITTEEEETEPFGGKEQQIREALGRPVMQSIRDQNQVVILNVGDLITYQAVERAKQAEALDELLNSVYE